MSSRNFIISVLIICFILFLFSGRAFADDASFLSVYNESSSIAGSYSSSDTAVQQEILDTWTQLSTNSTSRIRVAAAHSGSVFVAAYGPSGGPYTHVFLSHDSDAAFDYSSMPLTLSGSWGVLSYGMTSNPDYPGVYYNYTASSNLGAQYLPGSIPIYSSLDSVLAAFQNYTPVAPVQSTYNIPAGYVAIFSASSDIDLSTIMPIWSNYIGQPWPEQSLAQYKYLDSVPASFVIDDTWGSTVDWIKGQPRDPSGRSKSAVASIPGSSSYIAILAPYQWDIGLIQSIAGASPYLSSINITGFIDEASLRIYPVSQSGAVFTSGSNYYTSDGSGGWSNEDNEPASPPVGGYTATNSDDHGIIETISRTISDIKSLLLAPVDLITGLIEGASDIIDLLAGIFAWLPEELVSIIITSLTLLIILGVLKAFL